MEKEKSFGAARQSRKILLPSYSLHTEVHCLLENRITSHPGHFTSVIPFTVLFSLPQEAQAPTTNPSSFFFWVVFYCLPLWCSLTPSGNHPSCGRVLCQDWLPFCRSLQGHIHGPKQGRCRGVRAAGEWGWKSPAVEKCECIQAVSLLKS